MLNLKIPTFATAGVLVGMLAAVAASAADTPAQHGDGPTLAVRYNAAQLQSEQGVRELYVRLQRAAVVVCPQPVDLLVSSSVRSCRHQAVADAVAQIHSARLATLSNQSLKIG